MENIKTVVIEWSEVENIIRAAVVKHYGKDFEDEESSFIYLQKYGTDKNGETVIISIESPDRVEVRIVD